MYRNILVAIDLSPAAPVVLAQAKALLEPGGRLRVIHCEERRVTGYTGTAHNRLGSEMELKQEVFPLLKQSLTAAGIELAALDFRFGHATDEIVAAAEEKGADLIVLGSHGSGGVRALLGATVNAVLHSSPCDVYTVRVAGD